MSITQMDSTLYWSGLHLAISFVTPLSLIFTALHMKENLFSAVRELIYIPGTTEQLKHIMSRTLERFTYRAAWTGLLPISPTQAIGS